MGRCVVVVKKLKPGWQMSVELVNKKKANKEGVFYPSFEEVSQARFNFIPPDVHMCHIFPETPNQLNPGVHTLYEFKK